MSAESDVKTSCARAQRRKHASRRAGGSNASERLDTKYETGKPGRASRSPSRLGMLGWQLTFSPVKGSLCLDLWQAVPAGSGEASRLQEVAPLIVFVLTVGLNVECFGDRLLLVELARLSMGRGLENA